MSTANRAAHPQGNAESSTGRARNSRLGITREHILEGALGLLDRDGLDGLSMRRLAAHLGIGTMTLYGYFESKEELLDGLVEAEVERLSRVETGDGWKEGLRRMMVEIRRAHIEHPAIVELRYRRPLISRDSLRMTEVAMCLLRDAGFDKRSAARAYRSLFVYTFGYSAFGPDSRREAERSATLGALRALPAEEFPCLRDAAEEAADSTTDDTLFELGLDCLLDGLEAKLRSGTRRSTSLILVPYEAGLPGKGMARGPEALIDHGIARAAGLPLRSRPPSARIRRGRRLLGY